MRYFTQIMAGISIALCVQQAYSQEKVVPSSPAVASLGKFGVVPVSPYTGIPNIDIPLYTVKSGSLELPISLSYHAGGVKVEEVASAVGLGWALNAGGVIGRSIRGLADELGWYPQPANNTIEYIMLNGTTAQKDQLYRDVTENVRDAEPDVFLQCGEAVGKILY